MAKGRTSADRELEAMRSILEAFEGLDGDSIQRVLDYVFNRLSLSIPRHVRPTPMLQTQLPAEMVETPSTGGRRPSIRDLKDEKKPESANQMAALVAYYLSEVADEDRKDSINTADLEKYFKQAGFKLPKSLPQTLSNAMAAGYFDSVGNGLYRLNAVGYNLVVHGLPRSHQTAKPKAKSRTKKTARKSSK